MTGFCPVCIKPVVQLTHGTSKRSQPRIASVGHDEVSISGHPDRLWKLQDSRPPRKFSPAKAGRVAWRSQETSPSTLQASDKSFLLRYDKLTGICTTESERDDRSWEFACGKNAHSLALSPDNQYLLLCIGDRMLEYYAIHSGKPIARISSRKPMERLFILLDDHIAVTTHRDDQIRVWDLLTEEVINSYFQHTSGTVYLLSSPDGAFIASGDRSGELHIWPTPR
jgi:WD40 repeat protein